MHPQLMHCLHGLSLRGACLSAAVKHNTKAQPH